MTKLEDHRGVWVLGEQRNGRVQAVSFELLARGRALADALAVPLSAVMLGPADEEGLRELIQRGADEVLHADAPQLAHFLPDPYVSALAHLVRTRRPEIMLAAATTTGRTVMPLLSVKSHTGLTADCTGLDIEPDTRNLLQTRPAIGGNIMATIKTPRHRPQLATVRPRSARPLPPDPDRNGRIVREEIDPALLTTRVRRVKFESVQTDSANIQGSDVVVSGGKGMKTAENFALLHRLARSLNAAVGASRVAVDRGWISYPHQVGLSGKTVSPKLYLCAGVSGAIQHLAGIRTAEHVIAVNIDPEAQIFKVADFGIVGDLFEVLPMLIERIQTREEDRP